MPLKGHGKQRLGNVQRAVVQLAWCTQQQRDPVSSGVQGSEEYTEVIFRLLPAYTSASPPPPPKHGQGAGEMARELRWPAVLPEGVALIPNTHTVAHSPLEFQFQGIQTYNRTWYINIYAS